MTNPSRRRRSHRRRRRNPDLPNYAKAAIAAALATGTYAIVAAGSWAATQRMDPTLATLERNRYITSGLAVLLGLVVAAKKSPIYGAGVAAGALVAALGAKLTIALGNVLDKPRPQATQGAVYGNMGAYQQQMAGYLPMGAVYGNMGAVVPASAAAGVPAPPW